jgi:hypothetical protein
MNGGFWRDEGLFLAILRLPTWADMFEFVRFHESHPPLFYFAMRLWTQLFGDTDSTTLLVPVILGAALIPTLFIVGRSLFDEATGIVAASFAALSPILTEYSAVARPYSLMPLLSLLSMFALIRGLQRTTISMLGAYVVATTALVYTHNWSWLIVIAQWLAVMVLAVTSKFDSRTASLRWWLIAQACLFAAYAPWLPTLQFQVQHAGHGPAFLSLYEYPLLVVAGGVRQFLDSTILAMLPAHRSDHPWIGLLLMLPVVFLIATQYLVLRRRRRVSFVDAPGDKKMAIVCLVVVPAGAWLIALLLSARSELLIRGCLASLSPMVLLWLSYWLLTHHRGPTSIAARTSMVVLLMSYVAGLYSLLGTTRSNARELASAVASETVPSDVLIISPEWLASSFNRYYRPTIEQIDYPVMKRESAVDFTHVLGRFRNDSALNKVFDHIDRFRRDGRRVWLVVDRRRRPLESPSMIQSLLTSGNYSLVAFARTSQLRAKLDSLYGEPVETAVSTAPPRYESLRAFLYTPR